MSRGFSAGVGTNYGLYDRGIDFREKKQTSPLQSVQTETGAQPVSYPMGIEGKANHSPTPTT